ncbi:MAG TPA: ATP-binding cassette domain-containing protein, partial [Solirubrobacterales bacterium]|nr:ATP-binding cassette domain-containing protein [Solirubrobacterales bacterium]
MSAPLLEVSDLTVRYGGICALDGIDLTVESGEVVTLLGANGAGKTTLLRAISRIVDPAGGSISFDGTDLRRVGAAKAVALGIAHSPEGRRVLARQSVRDNLLLGAWTRKDGDVQADVEAAFARFPRLADRADQLAGNLSGGEQQMLTLGQAFIARPRLLMIDELSLGLAPVVVEQLLDIVRAIHSNGTTIVLVEQSVNVAITLAERAVFMEKGEVRFEGPTAELLDRPDILRSVFIAGAAAVEQGEEEAKQHVEIREREPVADDAPVVLECRDVVKRFGGIRAVDGVSLELREGQILGLIGQNGAGKTTLFDCISGFLPIDGGRILLRGHDISDWEPHERARARLGRSFQEAKLYPSLTTAEVIAVALERHLASRDIVAAALSLPASYESELAAAERVEEL